MDTRRRKFLQQTFAGAASLATAAVLLRFTGQSGLLFRNAVAEENTFAVTHTDEEWRKILTPEQYRVLRGHGTERAFTSPLNDEKRAGTFTCAACNQPLYDSQTKYESGTGWPSFYQPLHGAVGTRPDYGLHLPRTEVHCSRCGGHLGHVFEDGPQPTGLRYCMNGVAMNFQPKE